MRLGITKDKITELINNGYDRKALAEYYNTSRAYISRKLDFFGIELEKKNAGRPIVYTYEGLEEFALNHTMKELIEKYGVSVRMHIISHKIPYKKAEWELSEKTELILNDLRNGMAQSAVARKYNVSRQYVSVLNKKI